MFARYYSKLDSPSRSGFALISSLSLMAFLVLICLGFITLATHEHKSSKQWSYQQEAQANARMALCIAIGELQKYAGPDQRITANASILDASPETPEIDEIQNPHLLGVWRNCTANGLHLVGKDVAHSESSPTYRARDHYIDLRFSNELYKNNQWRDNLRLTWLASFKGDKSQAHQLTLSAGNSITLVGKGTLGADFAEKDPIRFNQEKLAVQKIDINSKSGNGSYAWAVIDNSQKAAITRPVKKSSDPVQIAVAQRSNLAGHTTSNFTSGKAKSDFDSLEDGLQSDETEILSYASAALVSDDTETTSKLLAAHFNHFTHDSSGLFTDPIFGGIKRDLTPLLFAHSTQSSLSFEAPNETTADFPFSSSYPIIPGTRHLTHGPNFDALRYWGRLKYASGLDKGKIVVDTTVDSTAIRQRPTEHWRGEQNDGYTFKSAHWHRAYPKIHPVMTDARYHFYFSLTDDSKSNRIRTHIIPRVCLWNPYNIELESPKMLVMMPNFFWSGGNFHFQLSKANELARLIARFPEEKSLLTWDGKLRFQCGSSNNEKPHSPVGLFPQSRYLTFVIEKTTFPAGSCLVFSPKPQSPLSYGGVIIQEYGTDDISGNVLSANEPQGSGHFYHDTQRAPFYQYKVILHPDTPEEKKVNREKSITDFFLDEIRLEEVEHYEPWVVAADNFDFVLKASNGSNNASAKEISISSKHPTLQLINGGSGGARTYSFYFDTRFFYNSSRASKQQFGNLQSFQDNPRKDAPSTYQIGSKLLWFDEQYTESNDPPLRQKFWSSSNHVAYNPAIIANWNVRPQLCTRSPASICSNDWHSRTSGAWITQLSPDSPQSTYDQASTNENGQYSKFPFLAAQDAPGTHSAALFDLPNPSYGALSIATLRHAQLSPYSWHPSYLIGSSLPDLHAPLGASAHALTAETNRPSIVDNQWDLLLGSSHAQAFAYGPRGLAPKSSGLLEIGDQAKPVTINQQSIETAEEMLAYDIAFETNQNLWDSYFISGLKLNDTGSEFVSDTLAPLNLHNSRFCYNSDLKISRDSLEALLSSSEGMNHAFWNAGYMLKNKSAFNINSTSIPAWTAFLSGIRGIKRTLRDGGSVGDSDVSVFSRCAAPENTSETAAATPNSKGGWLGSRSIKDSEIALLAAAIVQEVKKRGPFISLADMVNRRLIPETGSAAAPESQRGTIEAAIMATGLNDSFNATPWASSIDSTNDHNKAEFRHDYSQRNPPSKTWGVPGYLTQADILEPLAPAMTVRGDTFTIRCYGESRKGDKIKAIAYLEVVVMRTPDYIDAAQLNSIPNHSNLATDPAMKLDYADGSVSVGALTPLNKKYGRKFKVQSFRWLSKSEI